MGVTVDVSGGKVMITVGVTVGIGVLVAGMTGVFVGISVGVFVGSGVLVGVGEAGSVGVSVISAGASCAKTTALADQVGIKNVVNNTTTIAEMTNRAVKVFFIMEFLLKSPT